MCDSKIKLKEKLELIYREIYFAKSTQRSTVDLMW